MAESLFLELDCHDAESHIEFFKTVTGYDVNRRDGNFAGGTACFKLCAKHRKPELSVGRSLEESASVPSFRCLRHPAFAKLGHPREPASRAERGSKSRLHMLLPNGSHALGVCGVDVTKPAEEQRLLQTIETRQPNGRGDAQTR